MSPGWGVSSPPALHELGAGSCPPPGHEPVPAAPGTVAGTPGRLPRPPAHTHPRALARCGPFRLLGPPGAPPPPPCSGAPTPVPCFPTPNPLTPRQPLGQAPSLCNLGSSESGSQGGPRGCCGEKGGRGDRQTDRQGEGPACHLAPLQRDDGGQRRARR